jgi:hypothetical protein
MNCITLRSKNTQARTALWEESFSAEGREF